MTTSAAEHLVLTDAQGDAATPAIVGGKADGLLRLGAAGFDIPSMAVVTTDALSAQCSALGIDACSLLIGDDRSREQARVRLADEPLRPDLSEQLQAVIPLIIGSGRHLAVRSSGVAEDSAGSSFAGIYETVLGVTTEHVESAVRACWASALSDRVAAYSKHANMGSSPTQMAVIVQRLVDADASAVAFTHDPGTGNRDELVLAITDGLGEAIVAGLTEPDIWRIEKSTLRVVGFQPGQKHCKVVVSPRGGTQRLHRSTPSSPLPEHHVVALAHLCLQAEDCLQVPLDLEAVFDTPTWRLVQARPITTIST